MQFKEKNIAVKCKIKVVVLLKTLFISIELLTQVEK